MNVFLWILQGLLAWLCIAGGVFQIFKIEQLKENVASMRALPRALWAFFGVLGCVGGLGLVLPGAIDVLPVLTPIAAAVLAAQSALICAFYVYYRDFSPLSYSAAMTLMAVFVSYGRFELSPL
jgi:hypothetical protein